jgi:Dock homology region 2
MKTSKDKSQEDDNIDGENGDFNPDSRVRAMQISILRVINASDGYSKLFLGLNGTTQQSNSIAHYEAIEDALIIVANVFSPTELPEHRVAWLRLLAEFHHSRKKYAEEASCHYRIHVTLHLAAKLHRSLWSNTAFLPWTDSNTPNPIVYIDSDAGPAADPDCSSVANLDDWEIGGHPDSSNSFRRIFYRVANSIGFGNNEWETGESKTLFNGITFASEYDAISPWMTLREMEEHMVEEVEAAGALFLRSGIVDSSRFAWNLAAQYYAEKFNYAKLAIAYANLARVVVSQVPSIDTSLPQEMTTTLGRFYRVWFHGGAPDDLNGVEFVYRSALFVLSTGSDMPSDYNLTSDFLIEQAPYG